MSKVSRIFALCYYYKILSFFLFIMKKFIFIVILSLISICAFASDWKEVQAVEIPQETPIYYNVDNNTGKIKYYIYVDDMTVNVSETNVKAFLVGTRKLELVKWYNPKTNSYKYTVRQLKPKNINLNQIWQKQD